jgi:hypothetical protein
MRNSKLEIPLSPGSSGSCADFKNERVDLGLERCGGKIKKTKVLTARG